MGKVRFTSEDPRQVLLSSLQQDAQIKLSEVWKSVKVDDYPTKMGVLNYQGGDLGCSVPSTRASGLSSKVK